MTSLYELKNMKAEKSILKSVYVNNDYTIEGYPIVEVEANDETFFKATETFSKYKKTVESILKEVFKYYDKKDVWVKFYTKFGQDEYLVCKSFMKDEYNIV